MSEHTNHAMTVYSFARTYRAFPAHAALCALLLGSIIAGCTPRSGTTAVQGPTLPDEMLLRRTDIVATPMASLNSVRDDFGLTMPLDTTLVFFTSNRTGATGPHSIYWSRRSAGGWTKPETAVEVNNAQSNGMPAIVPDAESMYFAGCDYGFGDCDIYVVESGVRGSVKPETVPWTIPRNMGLAVNSSYWDSQPCIAADGSLLIFASDRPGGFGGRDIWICLRNQNGTWSRPLNAGHEINTVYDEVTPWIAPDSRTLFFASNGHPGVGGFDLFYVELDPESGIGPASAAVNLGQPINSTADDIALTVSSGGNEAFFSSNRSGGLGGYDIYQLSRPPVPVEPTAVVRGSVRDESGKPVFARVLVSSLSTGNIIGTFQTNPESGMYEIVLREGGDYAITAQAPNLLFHSNRITVPSGLSEKREFRTSHLLQPARNGTRLLLFFAPESTTLERESLVDLDFLVEFLKANADLRIEIGGHTDNVGDPDANRRLSLERARAVKAYLVGNRIGGERIDVKGYGDTRPIADNSTDEGRRANRRVEMNVLQTRAE